MNNSCGSEHEQALACFSHSNKNVCGSGHGQALVCFVHSNEQFMWLRTLAGLSLFFTQ